MKQALTLLFLLSAGLPASAVESKPNIVLLLAEDLRHDALEMSNLAADPAHQERLQQLRQQHREFTATLK